MQTTQTGKKRVIVLTLLAAVIVLATVVIYWYSSIQNPTDAYQPKYPVENTPASDIPFAVPNNTDKTDQIIASPQTSEEVPQATSGTLEIIELNQASGFVNARAKATNYSESKCVYQFGSTNARPIIREISGECSGISIPQVEFEKIGTYSLTVTAYNDTSKITATRDIAIR